MVSPAAASPCPARITAPLQSCHVGEGASVTLRVEAKGAPVPSVLWLVDGHPLQIQPVTQVIFLFISFNS